MDVKMTALVIVTVAVFFMLTFFALFAGGMVLLCAQEMLWRWMGWQPPPWRDLAMERMITDIAILGAASVAAFAFFHAPKDVYRNPAIKGVRVEFRQLSAWQSLLGPTSSDCFVDIFVTHMAAEGKRTTVKIIEGNPEYQEYADTANERKIQWARNGSGRVVVRTRDGETLFLPDLPPIPHGDVPYPAIQAYLSNADVNVVLQLLQPDRTTPSHHTGP